MLIEGLADDGMP